MSEESAEGQTQHGGAADIVSEQGLCLFDARDVR